MTPKVRRTATRGLFLLIASVHHTLSLPNLSDPGHIAKVQELHPHTDHDEVILGGRVVGEPDVRDTYTNLRSA